LIFFSVFPVSLSTSTLYLATMSDDKKNEDYTIELGEQKGNGAFDAAPSQRMPAAPQAAQLNSPVVAIFAYCGSSILMTTTNKYVLSGLDFNLNFFLLAVQVSSSTEYLTYRL
jgi:GDP-mannose transporter